MMGLSDGERISMIRSAVLIQYTRVTDRQTDRRNWRGIYIYALQLYAVARKNAVVYSVSKKNPPEDLWQFFQNVWEFFNQILHAYYAYLSTLDYEFSFN